MPEPSPHQPDLTWPALLARWTAFAQSSLALPKTADGERWRAAVSSIINLQAVTFALADLKTLTAEGERALALDKSEIIIRSSTGQLHALWRGDVLPDELVALVHDADASLKSARGGGVEWRVTVERLIASHPGELVDRLLELGFEGDLFVPTPGVTFFRNSPAAYAELPDGSRPDEHVLRSVKEFLIDVSRPEHAPGLRQVYRQFDFALGRPVRDLVVADQSGPPDGGGQPLLVPAIKRGRALQVTLPPRKGADIPTLPVVRPGIPAD
jgi:hypothetical protein